MPLHRRTLIASTAALAATATLGWLATRRTPAPETRFTLLDGGTLDTAALHGRVTLVNFWATTCVTCVGEMPQMIQTYRTYRDRGLELLAVAMAYDPPEQVRRFVQTRQLPFLVGLDGSGEAARQWGDVQATPTTYLLDRQGRIDQRYVGAPDFAQLHTRIDTLLAA